jgi:hypothetical protein
MINSFAKNKLIDPSRLLAGDPQTMHVLVQAALLNQLEDQIQAVCKDKMSDLDNRVTLETRLLQNLFDSTEELINRSLHGLINSVEQEFNRLEFVLSVSGMKFNDQGQLEDIEVDVKFLPTPVHQQFEVLP